MDVLLPRLAQDWFWHARGVRGDGLDHALAVLRAGHPAVAVPGDRRVRRRLARAVRRPQQAVRRQAPELLHRPALPADRPGVAAVEGVSEAGLELVAHCIAVAFNKTGTLQSTPTRRAACMDARRFPTEPWMASRKMFAPLNLPTRF